MKKRSSHIILVIATALLVFMFGCSHETDEFDGPSLIDRFGPFELVESLKVSSAEVDFEADETVFFSATFNKRTNWVVQIIGEESGSVKEIKDFSTELGPDNATWNGSTTDLPLFRAEDCLVKLIIPEEDSFTVTANVKTLSGRTYDGSLMTDFEENSPNIIVRNFEFEFSPLTGIADAVPAGQGQKSLLLQGTDGVVDNFFVGLIEVLSPIIGEQFIPLPSSIPEDVYFNSFVYGTGDPYTIAIFDFVTDADGDGVFDAGSDVLYSTPSIPLTWTGWQPYSIKMSDIRKQNSEDVITEEELSQLVGMRVVLISDNNSQPTPRVQVSFATDYFIFTKNQPLTP